MNEVILLMGYPSSGKSTIAADYIARGYVHINRDKEGGKVESLVPKLDAALKGGKNVILDNTFPTAESRKPFIETGQRNNATVICFWLQSTIEDAQFNASLRMMQRRGRLLNPSEFKDAKDPNLFPVAVLFAYRKAFQKPSLTEGFKDIIPIPFVRRIDPTWINKAVIFDYDGTLRKTKSGEKYPISPRDIEVFKNRAATIKRYAKDGYLLLGASNQSGIAKGDLTEDDARACFDFTNKQLGVDIEYAFCPHSPAPICCYCRKPMPGLGVAFAFKHKLDLRQCIFVGDMTTDRTFAQRCGMQYADQSDFFGDEC